MKSEKYRSQIINIITTDLPERAPQSVNPTEARSDQPMHSNSKTATVAQKKRFKKSSKSMN